MDLNFEFFPMRSYDESMILKKSHVFPNRPSVRTRQNANHTTMVITFAWTTSLRPTNLNSLV